MSLGEEPDRPQVNFDEIPDDFGNGSPVEVDTEVLAELAKLVAQLLDLAELLDGSGALLDGSGASKVLKIALELARKIYNDADEAFRRNVKDFRDMLRITDRFGDGTGVRNGGPSLPVASDFVYNEFGDDDRGQSEPPSIDSRE